MRGNGLKTEPHLKELPDISSVSYRIKAVKKEMCLLCLYVSDAGRRIND